MGYNPYLLITMVIGIGMVILMVIGMHTIMVITMDIMQTIIIATPDVGSSSTSSNGVYGHK